MIVRGWEEGGTRGCSAMGVKFQVSEMYKFLRSAFNLVPEANATTLCP